MVKRMLNKFRLARFRKIHGVSYLTQLISNLSPIQYIVDHFYYNDKLNLNNFRFYPENS